MDEDVAPRPDAGVRLEVEFSGVLWRAIGRPAVIVDDRCALGRAAFRVRDHLAGEERDMRIALPTRQLVHARLDDDPVHDHDPLAPAHA
jgi:hypothetical protein